MSCTVGRDLVDGRIAALSRRPSGCPGRLDALARGGATGLSLASRAGCLAVRAGMLPAAPGDLGVSGQERTGSMGIIAWIILGLLAGAIAKLVLPGDDPGGIIVTMLIGVAGALLGGWLAAAIFEADSVRGFFDLSTWITAIIGSVILLLVWRLITGSRRRA